jgi:hypothetical protein
MQSNATQCDEDCMLAGFTSDRSVAAYHDHDLVDDDYDDYDGKALEDKDLI